MTPWLVTSEEDMAVLAELNKGVSDRALGIIGASLVEIQLTKLIKRALLPEPAPEKNDQHREMFRSSGPLGPFSSKIRLAYLMGLISEDLFKDLENLKEIRNKFAHHTGMGRFKVQAIMARCFNFTLVDRCVIDSENNYHGRDDAPFFLQVGNAETKLKDPKERYSLSAQIFSIGLQHACPIPRPYTPSF